MNAGFIKTLLEARSRGPEALQALAETHLPLVWTMVRRFPDAAHSREELYQQGVIGLMKALHRFDPARGTSFSTYAAPMILGEMRMLTRLDAPVHIPRTETSLRRNIQKNSDDLSISLGREPTIQELADALHMDVEELTLHMEKVSVSSGDAESPGGTRLWDILSDPEDWQQRVELRDILSCLPEKDRRLILLRFHIGLTQTQTGHRLGMTQMQVSRREKIIRAMLKRALTE